ncbi:MAG: acyl-ACP desaturase [Actinomycetota bacterium]|nr:acyl-ACP desaturase [Actinomycetota bacterium]
MTTTPNHVPESDLLAELEPVVAEGLDRHLAVAREWFPHEMVPYEQGRSYAEEPWQDRDSHLSDIARTALEVNLLTEDNLPYYHLALWNLFGRDGAWGEWVRRWTAEEGRHAIAIRDFLTVTRGIDPTVLERGRMDHVSRGYYPEGLTGPLDGVVYTTLQELATRISHRNTGAITDDAAAERLMSRIAVDENLHYVFYRELGSALVDLDPSAMVLAMRRQVIGFAMPGLEIPGFKQKAIQMAKAGIYDYRIHHDQVIAPVILKRWGLMELEGLSDDAKAARDEIVMFMGALDAAARRYEDKRAAASTPDR